MQAQRLLMCFQEGPMKRVLPAIVLLLLLTELFILPAAATATGVGSPAVTTLPATNLTPFSATLNGSVNFPNIAGNTSQGPRPVIYLANGFYSPTGIGYFRYGTSPGSLTSVTPSINLSVSQLSATFSWDVVGLMPCTTYYAQAFILQTLAPGDYQPSSPDLLVSLLHSNLKGIGAGLDPAAERSLKDIHYLPIGGAVISFTTPGCSTPTVQHGTGAMGFNGGTAGISNITVQTAAISSTKVSPGEKVDITATVSNKGTANGATKVTLYINGQEVESKGITLASGQSEPVHFFVTQNDPGTYSVQVGGVSAGSFTVDAFNNNDILIYAVIALFTLGIAGTLFMLMRKRPA
jgi:hypothetical protein